MGKTYRITLISENVLDAIGVAPSILVILIMYATAAALLTAGFWVLLYGLLWWKTITAVITKQGLIEEV